MGFDPASFGGGYGAGQAKGRQDGEHAANLERIRARAAESRAEAAHENALAIAIALRQERNKNAELNDEIDNRWIPYAVTLKVGLVARRVERKMLIDELERLDPANAAQFAKRAADAADAEYAALEGARLDPVEAEVYQESEQYRLAKIARDEMDDAIREKRLYLIGTKIPFDWHEAFRLWLPLAESGNAQAQYNIGRCYSRGNGVDEDESKAVEWYMKAAAQGEPRAHCNLHLHYEENKDAAKSAEWLAKAVELGEPRACFAEAKNLMFDGDKVKARLLFERAVGEGNESAKLGLVACDVVIEYFHTTEAGDAVVFKLKNNSPYPATVSIWLHTFDFKDPQKEIQNESLKFPTVAPGESTEITYKLQSRDQLSRIFLTGYNIWRDVSDENNIYFPMPEKVEVWASKKSGCFILTACYGDHDAPTVLQYRQFRDNYLIRNSYGNQFISWYYTHGPRWAEVLDEMPRAKAILRVFFKLFARLLPR